MRILIMLFIMAKFNLGSIFKHGFNDPWVRTAVEKSGLSGIVQAFMNNSTQQHMTGAQQEQNAWTAQREDTANQRAVADMQAAGLNPALMYGHGTASASSQSASPAGSGTGISDLVTLMTLPLQMKAMKADIANTKADTKNKLSGVVTGAKDFVLNTLLGLDQHELNKRMINLREGELEKLKQDISFAYKFFDLDFEQKKANIAATLKGLEVSDAQMEKWKHDNGVSDAQIKEFAAKTNLEENQAWRILQLLPHEVFKMDKEALLAWSKSEEALASIQQAWVALELQRQGVNISRALARLQGIKTKADWYIALKELGIKEDSMLWSMVKGSAELSQEDQRIINDLGVGLINALIPY